MDTTHGHTLGHTRTHSHSLALFPSHTPPSHPLAPSPSLCLSVCRSVVRSFVRVCRLRLSFLRFPVLLHLGPRSFTLPSFSFPFSSFILLNPRLRPVTRDPGDVVSLRFPTTLRSRRAFNPFTLFLENPFLSGRQRATNALVKTVRCLSPQPRPFPSRHAVTDYLPISFASVECLDEFDIV